MCFVSLMVVICAKINMFNTVIVELNSKAKINAYGMSFKSISFDSIAIY